MTPFGAKQQKYYKTAVKATIERVLCTRVRATIVFQKSISKKRFSAETVRKTAPLSDHSGSFCRVLQCFLKALQNRSEKLKMAFRSTQFSISEGFYSAFRGCTHGKYYKNKYLRQLGSPRAQPIDKNSGFTRRPLQNRSEKPKSMQAWA